VSSFFPQPAQVAVTNLDAVLNELDSILGER
jgi:hypothetical protein